MSTDDTQKHLHDAAANPFLEMLGVRMSGWSDGSAEFRLVIRPQLMNRSGRVQGAVLCAILDAAAGHAGLFVPAGEPAIHAVTLSLTTQFLDSRPGRELKSVGRLQRRGRDVYFAASEVWLDEQILLATAVGTFKFVQSRV